MGVGGKQGYATKLPIQRPIHNDELGDKERQIKADIQYVERQPALFGNLQPMREFIYYKDQSGRRSVESQIQELQPRDRAKIYSMLDKLIEVDSITGSYYKPFRGYDFDFGEFLIGDFRIFASAVGDNKYLLLHVYRKKSNETPQREINQAIRNLEDYWAANPAPSNS